MTVIGLIADMHGDFEAFTAALDIFDREGVEQILCAGDIVDRGPDADQIIQVMQARQIPCVKGNHEYSVLRNQARWRQAENIDRMRQLGRIITDESLAYIRTLPKSTRFTIAETRLWLAHGVPWSDMQGVFPSSQPEFLNQLQTMYERQTDVMILGHTHIPMALHLGQLLIVNPGSVYGVTSRDSLTCATLALPTRDVTVFDLESGSAVEIEPIFR